MYRIIDIFSKVNRTALIEKAKKIDTAKIKIDIFLKSFIINHLKIICIAKKEKNAVFMAFFHYSNI